ncbi:hypothetical protein MNEG_15342 [Monoraphidium neglectum]|uniref:Uncharacterized protein n=1 Tax=Monoraphidium neglectum TaxID=145388 RepID=A0A0D2MBB2_9CHLO|nr:hypothetical protein MNEG_15342 [Monoraphidium neglectum]KIY92620.1 hypothetical protein MNEG_15342 [Monoraphidium neglectum]|eukprot:XP_013891640.1 hypothetical protein MNEG_15342 [Monoraphidium neglectum]
MGFTVEIQVQKVRSKTAGTRGIAVLEYDAASGQYHEVGQGPAGGGEGASSAGGAWRAREGPAGGVEGWDEEDEGEDGLDGGEEEGGTARADDDGLLGEQWDGEVLEFVGRRAAALRRDAALAAADEVHDLTRARDGAAAAGGEEREADWTTEDG